jgi:hypothetical protein
MAVTNRTEFKAKILRRLGDGAIQINVTDQQSEDCIDDALKMYHDFHYDGTETQYYKYEITQTDIDNKYITLPEDIIGATRIFPIGGFTGSAAGDILFNVQYHMVADLLYNLNGVQPGGLTNYFMTMQHLTLIQEMLVGQQPIRYNRHNNKLYVDMDWRKVHVGQWMFVEVFQIVDPEVNADVWEDRWLQNFTRALIAEQWASNLIKFPDMQLPGGQRINVEGMMQRALDMKEKLEDELKDSYTMPPLDFMA